MQQSVAAMLGSRPLKTLTMGRVHVTSSRFSLCMYIKRNILTIQVLWVGRFVLASDPYSLECG